MKKIITMAMAFFLFFSAMDMDVFAATDLSGHWAQQVIESWVSRGYVSGYPDGTFKPDSTITRAEFASIVNNVFNFHLMGNMNYYDVSSTDWYYNAISRGLGAGYLSGYGDGTIKPGNPVTREEGAVMIAKILNLTPYESGAQAFSDIGPGHWSKGYIGAVVNAGIMTGYSDTTFKPANQMTRAEVIVSLNYAFERIVQADMPYYIPSANQQYPDVSAYAHLMNNNYYYGINTNNNQSTNSSNSTNQNNTSKENVTLSDSSYGSSSNREVINGDAEVTATSMTMRNTDISGNLILSSRTTGTVSLQDVHASAIYVYGRANITLTDCDINEIYVESNSSSSSTKITAKGNTTIGNTYLHSECSLVESSVKRSNGGFEDVYLDSSLPKNARISLSGEFETVEVDAERIRLNLTSGKISDLAVHSGAENCTINLSSGTTVSDMDIDARYTSVTGSGKINTARVDARNVTFSRKPTTVRGSENPSYNYDRDDDYYDDDGDYSFYLQVLDDYNRDPIRNAYVRFSRGSLGKEYKGYTDSYGEIEFIDLPYGTYDLIITHSDYATSTTTIQINADTSRTIRLTQGSAVSFQVLDDSTGNPVQNATVDFSGDFRETTNQNGTATLYNVPSGSRSYRITAAGYDTATGSITVGTQNYNQTVRLTKTTSTTE